MDLRQLRYFTRIAELGSVSRASQALHIAQPALSQHVAQLEAELGQPLLRRLSTGVRMTEQGEILYRHAQRILRQVAEVEAAVTDAGESPSGSVAVGLPQSTACLYAMALVRALPRRYPRIALEFFDEMSGNLLLGLHAGRLDLAVVVHDDDARLLKSTPLLRERLFLVSRADQAPAGPELGLAELVELPLTLPGHGQGVRDIVEEAVRAGGAALPPPVVQANSMNIMRHAVLEGLAHTVAPWGAVADELAAGTFRATPVVPALQRTAYLCTARDAALTTAGAAVHDLVLDLVRVQAPHWHGVELLPGPSPAR